MSVFNITDMDLDEVSFVDKGANQPAHIILMKRLGKAKTKREMGEDFPASAFAYVPDSDKPSTWKLRLWDSISEKETAAQVGRAVAALGPGFRGQKVQIPSDDLSGVKAKVLAAWLRVNEDKNREDAPTILKSEGFMKKTAEEIQKELDELQKTHDELVKTNDELQKTHDDLTKDHDELKKTAVKKEDIDKSGMSDEVKKQFEKQETELADQAKIIAKMQDDRLEKEWISKAADSTLVGEATEVGKLLKSVAEASPETAESLMTLFKAANARIEKGNLFKELGTGGESEVDGALGELNKKAHDLAKAEKITFEKAFAHVYKTENKLRKQYLLEQKKA
ncbi:hypothetical protein KAR91_21895 [Candidatus Pacearchaeota archaeon]|nr:hypothetical protein [Candidatus Pacearchaeota archaeon]